MLFDGAFIGGKCCAFQLAVETARSATTSRCGKNVNERIYGGLGGRGAVNANHRLT